MAERKNAIVTGANGGIGRATLEVFAKNGINIWACMRKEDSSFLNFAKELCEKYNVWIKPVYFDLRDNNITTSAIKRIITQKQSVDILVNNAGVAHGAILQMMPIQTLRDVFEINFFSQMLIIQLVSHIMMRQKKGSIVNLSSVAGLDGDPGYVAYGSSKAAIAFATRSLSKELAGYNIRVNAVAPGLIKTHMMELMEGGARQGMLTNASMKRLGLPREIAEAIFYLASENASFITGQILRVDGGL